MPPEGKRRQREAGCRYASVLRVLPHRNRDASFHFASIPLQLVRNTTKFPRTVLRSAQYPGDLYLHGGYHLGSETLDLAQAVVSRPVDEGVHADFGDQAREFVDPVIHGTREKTLHGAVRDETHNVVDPADVLWLTIGGQGCVGDALLHLRQPFRGRV